MAGLMQAGASCAAEPVGFDSLGPLPDLATRWTVGGFYRKWHVRERSTADGARLERITALASQGSFDALTLTVERNVARKRRSTKLTDMKRAKTSLSSFKIRYEVQPADHSRFWLSTGMLYQRQRLMTNVGGHLLSSTETGVAAGWIQDDHWQLAARYLIDQGGHRRQSWRRSIQLAAGARATENSVILGLSYSPDFARADGLSIGVETRHDRLGAGDAEALGMSGRERYSVALALKAGF